MGRDVVDLIGGMEVSTVPEKWMVIREKRSVWHTIRSVVLDPVVLLFVIAHIRSSTSDARIEASGDLILLAIVTLLQPDSSPGDERESNGEDDQHDDPLLITLVFAFCYITTRKYSHNDSATTSLACRRQFQCHSSRSGHSWWKKKHSSQQLSSHHLPSSPPLHPQQWQL